MRTLRSIVPIAPFVALLCASNAGHAAPYVSSAGAMCMPQTTDPVYHTVNGATNPSTTTTSMFICPLPFGTQSASSVQHTAVVVNYHDFSDTDTFGCNVYEGWNDGSAWFSDIRWTCTNAGGCGPDQTVMGMGANYLQWNSTLLTHGTAIQYVTANYGVVCGVPRDKGFGESYLTTVYAY